MRTLVTPHAVATRNPKGDVDARGARGVTARAVHRFNLLSTPRTRTATRSLACSLLSVTRAVAACAGASATSTAAAAAPSNDARCDARARSKSLSAACAISAQCRVSRHHHANSLKEGSLAPCDLPNARLWRRRWRQQRRARGWRACGGGGVGGAREGGGGAGQPRRSAAAVLNGGHPVRAAVMAHISPATHSRHNGQRPACAGGRVGRRGSGAIDGRCVRGGRRAGVGRRRRQRRRVCDVESNRIKKY